MIGRVCYVAFVFLGPLHHASSVHLGRFPPSGHILHPVQHSNYALVVSFCASHDNPGFAQVPKYNYQDKSTLRTFRYVIYFLTILFVLRQNVTCSTLIWICEKKIGGHRSTSLYMDKNGHICQNNLTIFFLLF